MRRGVGRPSSAAQIAGVSPALGRASADRPACAGPDSKESSMAWGGRPGCTIRAVPARWLAPQGGLGRGLLRRSSTQARRPRFAQARRPLYAQRRRDARDYRRRGRPRYATRRYGSGETPSFCAGGTPAIRPAQARRPWLPQAGRPRYVLLHALRHQRGAEVSRAGTRRSRLRLQRHRAGNHRVRRRRRPMYKIDR